MSSRPRGAGAAAVLMSLFVLAAPNLGAQGGGPESFSWRFGGEYLVKASADLGTVLTAPTRWTGRNALTFAAFAGATGLLFAFDGDLYDRVQAGRTEATIDASSVVSKIGNGGYLLGFLGVLYFGGEAADSRNLRKTALMGVESFLAASTVVTVLKIAVGRARPYADEGPGAFHPFSFKGRFASFASGDAAGAFAVAATVAGQSGSAVVDALAYGLAGLAAVYRVHDRKHWPSDVFAGSVIGVFTAKAVRALNREGGPDLRVSFDAGRDRRSVSLTLAF